MTDDERYEFDERVAIKMDSGIPEAEARKQAIREQEEAKHGRNTQNKP